MNSIKITNSFYTTTSVPNEFIDHYMIHANGAYIKVYLFLLRMSAIGQSPTMSEFCSSLMTTEAMIIEALSYWQEQGLLRFVASTHNQIQYIELLPIEPVDEESAASAEYSAYVDEHTVSNKNPGNASLNPNSQFETQFTSNVATETPPKESADPVVLADYFRSGELSNLLYETETLLNCQLSANEINTLYYLHHSLKFPVDLIEYLVEYCAELNKTSMRYLEKVAISWHKKGILTREKAQEYVTTHNITNSSIMKAFGIYGRILSESELSYVKRWKNDYGFDNEIIIEACNRTMEKTHGPNFKYAEKILSAWQKNGVHILDDVKKLDELHARTRTKNSQKQPTSDAYPHNFEQRAYNYDDMAKQYIDQLNHIS